MTKDYAKRVYLANQKPKPSQSKKIWLIMVLVLVASFIGYLLYAKYKKPDELLLAKISSEAKAIQAEAKALEQQAVHFEFYDQLPNMQVKVAEELPVDMPQPPVKAKLPTAATTSTTTLAAKPAYVIELGFFTDSSAAGELRLSLLLSGIETNVSKIHDNGKVIYRVMQGPFVSLSEAKSSQQKLRRKGFESEIKASN